MLAQIRIGQFVEQITTLDALRCEVKPILQECLSAPSNQVIIMEQGKGENF